MIFDLIFKTNLIGTVINAKTTCLLVNVVFKLQKEYDDFVLTVLRFAEKVEKVLAVLLQVQIMKKRSTLLLQNIANYVNGYTLSQHIQGLPTNQSAKYTGY